MSHLIFHYPYFQKGEAEGKDNCVNDTGAFALWTGQRGATLNHQRAKGREEKQERGKTETQVSGRGALLTWETPPSLQFCLKLDQARLPSVNSE